MNFGRARLTDFPLDPRTTYLNHGTVGVAPRRVLAARAALLEEIEANPARFMLRELADPTGGGAPTRLRAAAAHVADFVGADADGLVFTDNVTTSANAVLRSFPFAPGDELLVTDLGYGGVTNAAVYAARSAGITVRTATMPLPGAARTAFLDALVAQLTPATRLVVVDHLSANTALLLPLAEIAAACHARDIAVFADGAHVPGNVPLDITALGVDFYGANLHKWAWAPRSCGILWVAPLWRASIHPAVISWGLDLGLAAEFDLPGTRDPTPMLTAPLAIELLREHGLDDLYGHNHGLAWRAASLLSERWQTPFATPEEMVGSMVTVPLPAGAGSTLADAVALLSWLTDDRRVEVPVFALGGGLMLRVSAQIYNDEDDIERLATAVTEWISRDPG